MRNRLFVAGFRFAIQEIYVLLFRRTWLYTIAFLGLYSAFTGYQTAYIYRVEHQPLNGWQTLAMMFGGPPPRASVLEVLKWISLPTAFLLSVGEPFSASSAPWNRMVFMRMPSRWLCWWGKATAWYSVGLFFVALAMGMGLLVEVLLLQIWNWELPPVLTLGNKATGSSFSVTMWVGFNLLSVIWSYTTVLFIFSLFLARPGIATVATIIVGYLLTILGTHATITILYIRPVLGARLNALGLPGSMIDTWAYCEICLSVAIWLTLAMVGGYFIFRERMF